MTRSIEATSWNQAQGMGVLRAGRIVAVWWDADTCGGREGSQECAGEFAYEFGGAVVPVKRKR